VAFFSPSAPIILIYAQEIGKIDAEPHGALESAPNDSLLDTPSISIIEWLGKYGAKCFFTPIGPIPGPPPPCGIQNVLCKFKWQTSKPISEGLHKPTLNQFKIIQNSKLKK
jgi:hypothetical protein